MCLIPSYDVIQILKIVLEHITTKVAVEFVRERGENLAATLRLTILVNRNHMLSGGILHIFTVCQY